MPDPSSDVHLLKPPAPVLNLACVEALAKEIARTRQGAHGSVAIDLSGVQSETPQGVAALIELANQAGTSRLALCGLPRRLLSCAIDVGLAELVPLYTSAESVRRLVHEPHRGVRAVIYEVADHVGAGWMDIAGRPLLVRQLQWLRDAGIEEVLVELCAGEADSARGAWLLGDDPLISRVSVVPTGSPVGPAVLAERAGLARDQRVLQLPADTLLGGTLPLDFAEPTTFSLKPPADLHAPGAVVDLAACSEVPGDRRKVEGAWGLRIEELTHALDIGCAALLGQAPGIMVHGLEQRPGVWLARGASIAASARVDPPVFLGVGALVLDGAEIGPRAVLLEHAVVERGASVTDATVAANTLVGEGTRVRRALATPRALVSFDDATRTSIIDSLVLTSRAESSSALTTRAVALLLLLLLGVPWLIFAGWSRLRSRAVLRTLRARGGVSVRVGALGVGVLDLFPPLLDALLGNRDLVGVGRENVLQLASRRPPSAGQTRAGAIDLTSRLTSNGSPELALRMWRWYARRKTNSLDRALLLGREPRQ